MTLFERRRLKFDHNRSKQSITPTVTALKNEMSSNTSRCTKVSKALKPAPTYLFEKLSHLSKLPIRRTNCFLGLKRCRSPVVLHLPSNESPSGWGDLTLRCSPYIGNHGFFFEIVADYPFAHKLVSITIDCRRGND